MANTTNFGWETPDDTDLVKDGAAAMRTLGNSIDASFVDLKGGTTGQVLSKASNTDLDYSWITPNVGDITEVQAGTGISVASGSGPIPVVTNSMATTIDAKGDLIVGTGADTFARLAVGGTNGHTLQVDSSTSTGLKWAASGGFSAWTSYTPTITSGSGSITTYTSQGYYVQSGSLLIFTFRVNLSNVGTAAGTLFATLPVTAATKTNGGWVGTAYDYDNTGESGSFFVNSGGTTGLTRDYNFGTWFNNGVGIQCTIVYEVAP